MKKDIYFNRIFGPGWPEPDQLEPYFRAPPLGRGWFHETGNDSGSLRLQGVDGTEDLPQGRGRIDITLRLWGHPDLRILLIYTKRGGGHREEYTSKGDLSRLRGWVRTTHDDPMPAGLYIPFAKAWLAVKEFMDTEGQLPNSIEWVKNSDLPPGTFPNP